MVSQTSRWTKPFLLVLPALTLLLLAPTAPAQNLLPTYPGYAQYQQKSPQLRGNLVTSGASPPPGPPTPPPSTSPSPAPPTTTTSPPARNPKPPPSLPPPAVAAHPPVAAQAVAVAAVGGVDAADKPCSAADPSSPVGIVRPPFATSFDSPDRQVTAFFRDNNLFLRNAAQPVGEIPVTTDGSTAKRIRYGQNTLIYGEELGMGGGIFWAPDSKKLAYYRFDESTVKDYTVIQTQVPRAATPNAPITDFYESIEIDAYPKAGTASPRVDLFLYDLATKKSTPVDVRSGKEFTDDNLGYYVYRIAYTPGGKELLFSRMDRKQDRFDLCAADLETGEVRVIIHEERLANWVDWTPTLQYLADGNRFIWSSERTDFKHYYLYDLSGKQLATLTRGDYEVARLVKIDEAANTLFYMARDGDNYQKLQLHRVNLDGTGDLRLTDPAFNHSVSLAPNNKYFIDTYQTHDRPAASRLVDDTGKIVAELAQGNLDAFTAAGFKPVEVFTFKTFDNTAELHGMLHFPSTFDPAKKYPLLLNVYGGPNTSELSETFTTPNALTEYGFLLAQVDARDLAGRGRKFSDPYYHHMGIVEMDDQAAGIKALAARPYVNPARIGVYGTSYGGTTAATLLMRYPDLFAAACANSPVTDYRNYNIVYAERNNGLVSENKAGYDAAAVMTYVPTLKGRLLLYYGTADNNVHPSNSLQLIAALQRANKSFDLQVGPDRGHTSVSTDRMMEFFIENIVLK